MARKKRKKKSLLEHLGVKVAPKKTADELISEQRHENYIRAYEYVRFQIDKGVRHFYEHRGDTSHLEQYVERPALDELKRVLQRLRADRIVWRQPGKRKQTTAPKYEIVDESLDRKGRPQMFVIEETFTDHSVHHHFEGGQPAGETRCPGVKRTVRATIRCYHKNGQSIFRLQKVTRGRAAA